MSSRAPAPVLRPASPLKKWLTARLLGAAPFAFRLMRRFTPILRFGSTFIVTRHDDVREVFANDPAFGVPYKERLDVITAGEPFFLGMADTPAYHEAVEAMRRVVRADDLPMLARQAEALSAAIVAAADGEVEVVQLVRDVTFRMLGDYFGVPDPPDANLQAWATRLFEFQFVGGDAALVDEVKAMIPELHAHVDGEIARRKAAPDQRDDVLARCLKLQAEGAPGYSDIDIRTALVCMIVGGPPQPPMVVPQAMEQLLRRPEALRIAQDAARTDDDALLHDIVIEAMRFDPLAPGLPRTVLKDVVLAKGTRRQTTVPAKATVFAAFASAMMDDRRVPEPRQFRPGRCAHEYVHFGYRLHECFGRHINHATLHLMLKPLLRRPRLRRAAGAHGRLSKNGPFAERLVVAFDKDQAAA